MNCQPDEWTKKKYSTPLLPVSGFWSVSNAMSTSESPLSCAWVVRTVNVRLPAASCAAVTAVMSGAVFESPVASVKLASACASCAAQSARAAVDASSSTTFFISGAPWSERNACIEARAQCASTVGGGTDVRVPRSGGPIVLLAPRPAVGGRGGGVDRREREDDQAVEDLPHRLRGVQDRQQRIEHGQDQRAEDRACVAADAAEDRGAADDDGRDGRQQERGRDPEVGGVVEADEQDPGGRAEGAAERVKGEQHLPRPDAREPARNRVVADRVD